MSNSLDEQIRKQAGMLDNALPPMGHFERFEQRLERHEKKETHTLAQMDNNDKRRCSHCTYPHVPIFPSPASDVLSGIDTGSYSLLQPAIAG